MTQVLKKGANVSLTQIVPTNNEILIGVEWCTKQNNEIELDIDASAFMLGENHKIRCDEDFIFYNQPKSLDGSFELLLSTEPDTQNFKVSLNRIDSKVNKVSVILTIHDAKKLEQSFGMLEKISISILNPVNKIELVNYVLDDVKEETALILGEMYRHNNDWKFRAIGQGYIDGLDVLASNFGVNIGEDSGSTPKEEPVASQKPIVIKERA